MIEYEEAVCRQALKYWHAQIGGEIPDWAKPREVEGEYVGGKLAAHGASNSFDIATLRALFDVLPKGKFLDLGFGIGELVIYAANQGWDAFGIEYCQNCYTAGEQGIAEAVREGFIQEGQARIALGNFYPRAFRQVRDGEERDRFRETIEHHVAICPDQDPYAQLGITPGDVDLFFHYEADLPENLVGFFAEFAKPGARFMFVRSQHDLPLELPTGVVVEWEYMNQGYLLKKE